MDSQCRAHTLERWKGEDVCGFWGLEQGMPSKDDFPLPHIDVLVYNMVGSPLMSFIDGFSGYK